jgi:hypothetical protein
LPLALGTTALANIALTFFLPGTAFPIRFHNDGSLTHLVRTEQISVDRRFGLYFELGDATEGGILVIPAEPPLVDAELVEGFAGLEVSVCEFDPAHLPPRTADGAPTGVFETEDRDDLLYWIVSGDSDLWWLTSTAEGLVLVPDSVVALPEECT